MDGWAIEAYATQAAIPQTPNDAEGSPASRLHTTNRCACKHTVSLRSVYCAFLAVLLLGAHSFGQALELRLLAHSLNA